MAASPLRANPSGLSPQSPVHPRPAWAKPSRPWRGARACERRYTSDGHAVRLSRTCQSVGVSLLGRQVDGEAGGLDDRAAGFRRCAAIVIRHEGKLVSHRQLLEEVWGPAYETETNYEPAEGWGQAAAQTVRRFGEQAEVGDFVWTRDTSGRYLLCKITGDYRYDISDASKRVDVHQVRDVAWAPRPLNDLEVPGGVIRRFVGTGSSFSRIHDDGARLLTPYLWKKLHGRPLPQLAITPAEVLASHLDPYDVEDLVYVWLQVARDFVALPRARQRDTPAYEWTMIHRGTGRRGIVQIKTGSEPGVIDAGHG